MSRLTIAQNDDLHYLLSPELLAEYRQVLLRPAIRKRHSLSATEIDDLLESLVIGDLDLTSPPALAPAPPLLVLSINPGMGQNERKTEEKAE